MKRPREYLTEKEIERLMDAAGQNRQGYRDATAILGTPWQNCVSAGINRTVAPETHLRKNRTFGAFE
jgi:hypothetical protein